MKIILLLLIILTSCSNINSQNNNIIDDIDIDRDLSFNEFKNIIIKYAEQSNYPDIN